MSPNEPDPRPDEDPDFAPPPEVEPTESPDEMPPLDPGEGGFGQPMA